MKGHPLRNALQGGVPLALFFGITPLRSPVVDSGEMSLWEALRAAVYEGAGAASHLQQAAPAVPVQMVNQILMEPSHEAAPVEVKQGAAAQHIEPQEKQNGGQDSGQDSRKGKGQQPGQNKGQSQQGKQDGGHSLHHSDGDPVAVIRCGVFVIHDKILLFHNTCYVLLCEKPGALAPGFYLR